jgi:hypothetical protein
MGTIGAILLIAMSQATATVDQDVQAAKAQECEVAVTVEAAAPEIFFVPDYRRLMEFVVAQSGLSEKEKAELAREMKEMQKELESELKKMRIQIRRAPRGAFMIHGGFDPHVSSSSSGERRAKNQAMRRVVTRF